MHILGGPLNGEYYEECVALVEKFGLKDKIFFKGSVAWELIVANYSSARITLIPTIALEGTSLSALESMACKTPVVATNVGGLNDLPCENASPDPKLLCSKMLAVDKDWPKFSKEQYNNVKKVFNLDNWAKAWLSVINEAGRRY